MSSWLPKISDDYVKMTNIAKNVPRCLDEHFRSYLKGNNLVCCMWYSKDTKSKLSAFYNIFRENWINIYLNRTEDFTKNELHTP